MKALSTRSSLPLRRWAAERAPALLRIGLPLGTAILAGVVPVAASQLLSGGGVLGMAPAGELLRDMSLGGGMGGVFGLVSLATREREWGRTDARSARDVIATMSHELRTPMNAILGHAQRLQASCELDESARDGVDTILSSSRALLELINASLDMAAVSHGTVSLTPGPVNVQSVVEEVSRLLAASAEPRGLTLVVDVDRTVPHCIIADERRVRQVLVNLMGNGVKYTEQGSISCRVTSPRPEQLCIVVEDTGIGIPADKLGAVFERFERATDAREGTGLGLYITRELVRAMGGDIRVHSTEGVGTRVQVTLPTGVVEQPVLEDVTVFPNAAALSVLHESAAIGDMRQLTQCAQELAAADNSLGAFANQLCALAAAFDDQGIAQLLSREAA